MQKVFYRFKKKLLKKFSSYAIVDDLLATGGKIDWITNLLNKNGKEVCGLVAVVKFLELNRMYRSYCYLELIILFQEN